MVSSLSKPFAAFTEAAEEHAIEVKDVGDLMFYSGQNKDTTSMLSEIQFKLPFVVSF